jgi:hypothetical protein
LFSQKPHSFAFKPDAYLKQNFAQRVYAKVFLLRGSKYLGFVVKDKSGKIVRVKVCPRCLSPRLRKVGSFSGDMIGSMGYLPWKYGCLDCGWIGRTIVEQEVDLSKLNSRKEKD